MPLAEAAMMDDAELGTGGQSDGFGNECEGCPVCWQSPSFLS